MAGEALEGTSVSAELSCPSKGFSSQQGCTVRAYLGSTAHCTYEYAASCVQYVQYAQVKHCGCRWVARYGRNLLNWGTVRYVVRTVKGENQTMVLAVGRSFAAACAAHALTGQTWPCAAAWEPPGGWPQSAPACVYACMHARMHACVHMQPSFRTPGCLGRVPFGNLRHQGRLSAA
eukprot:352252-Chlamydomonas_euryale.AAC.3